MHHFLMAGLHPDTAERRVRLTPTSTLKCMLHPHINKHSYERLENNVNTDKCDF